MQSRIPTESKRQAMDWSLVLLSQGIEATIERSEQNVWNLVVEDFELAPAQKIIAQYLAENSRWPWQQKLFHEKIAFDWGSLAWVLLMCLFFVFSESSPRFRDAGLMDSRAVSKGEWWRLFTAIDLHADIAHLLSNAGFGFVLLGLSMGRYGTGVGLLAAFLAGVGGNAAALLAYGQAHRSLGASGMVMGCLGLLAAQTFSSLKHDVASLRLVIAGFIGGVMLFVFMGLAPGTDVMAHLGGFLSGMIFGAALSFASDQSHRAAINLICGGIFSLLVIVPWWLASHFKG